MRRIYLLIFIILMAACLFVCLRSYETIQDFEKIRDSLTTELSASIKRQEVLKQLALQEKKKYLQTDSIVHVLKAGMAKPAKVFHKKIREIETYTATQLDTFFIERYPESKYANKPSFLFSVKPLVIPEWRSRLIAQDLIRLDSTTSVAIAQKSIISRLEESIEGRDRAIIFKDLDIAEKDKAFSIVLQRESTYAAESAQWKGIAKTYKRQRNGIIVVVSVVSVVVVGGLYLAVTN